MTYQDLIWGMVYNDEWRAEYRYEFRARDKGAGGRLVDRVKLDDGSPPPPKSDHLRAKDWQAFVLADEMLESEWDFSGMRDRDPEWTRNFVQTISDKKWAAKDEFDSERQWNTWSLIVTLFSDWRRLR